MPSVSVADNVQPTELMRLVGHRLTASGVDTGLPGPGNGRRLTLACLGTARCVLLTGQLATTRTRGTGCATPGPTLTGIVGLERNARSLDLEPETCEDKQHPPGPFPDRCDQPRSREQRHRPGQLCQPLEVTL
jgi:hypothetical protein